MQGDNSTARFLARFEASQRAKGRDIGPLFSLSSDSPSPTPTTRREFGEFPACRTVQEIIKENQASRPAPIQITAAERFAEFMPPLIRAEREYRFNVSDTLTACLDTAECPRLARRMFRLLHELALISIRARGLPSAGLTVGVYHLPLELLAAHFRVDRTTIWRNLQPLVSAGVLDARDHYGRLKGQTAVTGKVWAVSINPERQLSGHAEPVKVRHHDLTAPWRNLDADTESGRTVWNLTRTEEQKAAYKAQREAKAEERAEARARAQERAKERQAAKERGEKPLTGRKAATENAAKTRAENPRPTRRKSEMQQSMNSLKAVEKQELIKWVLDGFTTSTDVTLTVATAISHGLDVIFTLPSLAGLPRQRRNAEVEKTARALAATFEDTANTRFWCWLVWQLIRGADQGQNYADDVAHLLARVLHDIKHDESMYSRSQKKPAALVVAKLKACGIYDALKLLAPTRAGGRPKAQA
ncbi:hypothetical protein [Deinococcus fonticola]|uniref:hypothetical protein n=1 Tax=Deinococcus fonticola TaxID=2528713 RepID=UPI0010749F2B|nr:hypothetical protein [Deinococcus fonticola]